jgi:hypothetical protein
MNVGQATFSFFKIKSFLKREKEKNKSLICSKLSKRAPNFALK